MNGAIALVGIVLLLAAAGGASQCEQWGSTTPAATSTAMPTAASRATPPPTLAPRITLTATPTVASQVRPTVMPPATALPTPGPTAVSARVVRVVDGDTLEVEMGGRRYTVRHIGIDAPETVDPRRPAMCYGQEASRRHRQLVEGKTVLLEKDVSETDRYGRLLRYVWADGVFVNAALVQEGYARAYTVPPDVKHAELFRRLEREARETGRGLWGACPAFGAPAGER